MISRANLSNFAGIDGAAVNRILPPLVSLVLVVLIGWQIARMIWMLVPGSAVGVAVPLPDSIPVSNSSSSTSTDVSAIAAAHIFGIADAEESVLVPIVAPDDDGSVHALDLHRGVP